MTHPDPVDLTGLTFNVTPLRDRTDGIVRLELEPVRSELTPITGNLVMFRVRRIVRETVDE